MGSRARLGASKGISCRVGDGCDFLNAAGSETHASHWEIIERQVAESLIAHIPASRDGLGLGQELLLAARVSPALLPLQNACRWHPSKWLAGAHDYLSL